MSIGLGQYPVCGCVRLKERIEEDNRNCGASMGNTFDAEETR